MHESDLHWHPIPETLYSRLDCGELVEWEVEGQRMCLARHRETIHAFQANCPHASGRLTDGRISLRGEVVCPLHGYRFQLESGFNSSGEGYRLKTHPLRYGASGWELGLPKPAAQSDGSPE